MQVSHSRQNAFRTVVDEIDTWIKYNKLHHARDSKQPSGRVSKKFVCSDEGTFSEVCKWLSASDKCKPLERQFVPSELAVEVTLTEESLGDQPIDSQPKTKKRKSVPGLDVAPGRRCSARIAEQKRRQHQSSCLQKGAGPLDGVKVLMVGLDPDEEMMTRCLVEDLAGAVISLPKEASHALVPLNVSTERWEQELWPQLQEFRKSRATSTRNSCNAQIVSINWLEEFTNEDWKSPWDENMCLEYIPDFVQQQVVHGSHRRSSQQHKSSPMKPPGGAKQSAQADRPDRKQLAGSLKETKDFLSQTDLALPSCDLPPEVPPEAPEDVLGVAVGASEAEVRAAYKKKALVNHPDKGGDAKAFNALQQAYWALLRGSSSQVAGGRQAGQAQLALPSGGERACDFQLRGHKELVKSLFQQDGVDLDDCLGRQDKALRVLGLQPLDLGAVSRNERNEEIYNQCFYLSMARSYLGQGHQSAELRFTALNMKRTIEAEVLAAHPDWAGSRVGEDVQAFSDFLFYVLGTHALLSELSVAIFDSVSGGVELYIGRQFPGEGREEEQRANLLTLRYTPGHYQALVPKKAGATSRPTLAELEKSLCENGVLYVPTVV